jgi:hypothetical protein
MEKMRARKDPNVNKRVETRRSAQNMTRSGRNDGSSTKQDRDVLIATLTELHGRSSEVARRMMDDARILADVQRETAAVLLKLWTLRSEPPQCFLSFGLVLVWHLRLGTLLGTLGAFFTRVRSENERKRAKATVLLTAASAAREIKSRVAREIRNIVATPAINKRSRPGLIGSTMK